MRASRAPADSSAAPSAGARWRSSSSWPSGGTRAPSTGSNCAHRPVRRTDRFTEEAVSPVRSRACKTAAALQDRTWRTAADSPKNGDPMKTVLILGAGFAGLELATVLSDEVPDEVDVTIVDSNDAFVFGFSKLDVMFGRSTLADVRLPYARLNKPSVRFVQETVIRIDPDTR